MDRVPAKVPDEYRLTRDELAGELVKWDALLWDIANHWWSNADRAGERDDYHSEAVLGFIRAAEHYDKRRNLKFVTYAADWSRSYCRRLAAKELARGMAYLGTRDELRRAPVVPIAGRGAGDPDEAGPLAARGLPESWLAPGGERRRPDARSPRSEELSALAADLADAAGECLTDLEARVVAHRHRDGMSLREVGVAVGLTGERIRAVLKRAHAKLRRARPGLRDYAGDSPCQETG